VQQAINTIAASPDSQSASLVKKCLTLIRAVFTAAILDEILERQPRDKDRHATLPPPLEAAVREYVQEEGITDLLFPSATGTPMSHDNYLDRTLKRLGIQAGIDVFENADGTLNSRLNHQVLRRTTATHFQKHGRERTRRRSCGTRIQPQHWSTTRRSSTKASFREWTAGMRN